MLIFQVMPLESALKSINLDIVGFLFGMFSIVIALDIHIGSAKTSSHTYVIWR